MNQFAPLPSIFRNPITNRSMPIFLQDDVPLGLLQPLRALLQNYGAHCVDNPEDAAVIVISNKSSPLAQHLVSQHSVSDPCNEIYGRAVVAKSWIMACIEDETVLGPPTWGDFYIKKDLQLTSSCNMEATAPLEDDLSSHPEPTAASLPETVNSRSSASPSSTAVTSPMSEQSLALPSSATPEAQPQKSRKRKLKRWAYVDAETGKEIGEDEVHEYDIPPEKPSPKPKDEPKKVLYSLGTERGKTGRGIRFTEGDEMIMVSYLAENWDDYLKLSNRSFWDHFAQGTPFGKTRTTSSWIRQWSRRKEHLETLARKARNPYGTRGSFS